MRSCFSCGAAVDGLMVGARDTCRSCESWLHCCRNCAHYAPGMHNDCRETQADHQSDKEKGNFCDFFRFDEPGDAKRSGGAPADARAQLEGLFRKKESRR